MLGHPYAKAAFESSWRSAWLRIALVPSKSFCALLQNFDGWERIVWIARVSRLGPGDVHETELDRVESESFGHLIHHAFPGPLGFLLVVAAGGAGPWGIGFVSAPYGLPIGHQR